MTCDTINFEKMIGVKIPCDYGWDNEGIVRIGAKRDIAAYAAGDFAGKCIIFLHGNGETAISEKELYIALNERGVSVIAPDYRGYGLSAGEFSEKGCYEAAHAAYEWLCVEKQIVPSDIIPLGYSLGSGVAVELAAAESVGGLILQAPYYSGRALLPYWIRRFGYSSDRRWRFILPLRRLFLQMQVLRERSFGTNRRLHLINCPSLVFHGTCDTIIPATHGEKVFDGIASRQKEFVRVDGGSHNDFQHVMGFETYVDKIFRFCMSTSRKIGGNH